jgi:hypothetical protein
MSEAWSSDLTYGYLERLLDAARERFELRPLRDGPGGPGDPPRAIVRHDVDVSLRHAVALAEREAGWGVQATFLVQVDCPLYRLDDDGRAALARIASLGHELGLHVDVGEPGVEDGSPVVIEQRVQAAAERLSAATGEPIRSLSFHRPAPTLLRGPNTIAGMVNAYGEQLMSAYLSDSEGRWRHGEPLPLVRASEGRFLQLLVHPIWWADQHLSPGDRLQEFFEGETARMNPAEIEAFDAELLRAVEPAKRSGLA